MMQQVLFLKVAVDRGESYLAIGLIGKKMLSSYQQNIYLVSHKHWGQYHAPFTNFNEVL